MLRHIDLSNGLAFDGFGPGGELESAAVDAINLPDDAKSGEIADTFARLLEAIAKHAKVEYAERAELRKFASQMREARCDGDRLRATIDEFEKYAEERRQAHGQ